MVTSIEKRELAGAENTTAMSMLFDYYGQLLSDRQYEIFRLYYEEDYSLSEIAKEFDISRQGVHDALKKAEVSLTSFEDKLKLIAKHEEYLTALNKINETIKILVSEEEKRVDKNDAASKKIRKLLNEMEHTVSNLDI